MEDFLINVLEPLLLLALVLALVYGLPALIIVAVDKKDERQEREEKRMLKEKEEREEREREEEKRRERELEEKLDILNGLKKVKMVCSCGQEYPDGCKFCAVDGQALKRVVYDNSKLICPKCNKEFPTDAKYCPEHGKLLIKVAK